MKKLAYLCVLSAGILWGCMGLFVRSLTAAGFSALQIVTMRLTVAALCFVVLAFFRGIKKLKMHPWDIPLMLCLGLSGVMMTALTYFLSITYSSLSVAAILMYTAPAFVMIASIILFKERFTLFKAIILGLVMLGMVFVSGLLDGAQARVSFMGILFGILSGIAYGSYSVFGTYALRRFDSFSCTTIAFVVAALGSLPFGNVSGIISTFSAMENAVPYLLLVLAMGILSAFLPFLLYTIGLSRIQASKAIVIASVEPVTATVLGFVAYKEVPTMLSLLGIVLIIASVIMTSLEKGEQKEK